MTVILSVAKDLDNPDDYLKLMIEIAAVVPMVR